MRSNQIATDNAIATAVARAYANNTASTTTTPHIQPSIPPPSGLVSWWPGDGNFRDIQGSNTGKPQGVVTFGQGEVGQAFLLNGTDAAIDAGNASSLHVSSHDFTVDAWVKFHSLTSDFYLNDLSIVDKMFARNGVVNSDGWRLFKQNDNHFWFCLGGNTVNGCGSGSPTTVISTTSATDQPLGTWFHVAAVKSNHEIAIYVNGVQEASMPLSSFLDTNSTDLFIGANAAEGSHFNGLLDEVQIFNRALSASEIQAIYNARSAGQTKP
jgi:hypothetical protein